ncbi:hypothetical protein ACOBV9_14955 [Pseudoalteromonas espejiana]
MDELSETTNLEKTDLSKLIETIRSKVEELTNLTEEISFKKSQLFDLDNETAELQTLKKMKIAYLKNFHLIKAN